MSDGEAALVATAARADPQKRFQKICFFSCQPRSTLIFFASKTGKRSFTYEKENLDETRSVDR
jgi:hypothetical protein